MSCLEHEACIIILGSPSKVGINFPFMDFPSWGHRVNQNLLPFIANFRPNELYLGKISRNFNNLAPSSSDSMG